MNINARVAKIPFFILYLTLVLLTLFNWIRVIAFQQNFEVFRTQQPWDYYLSRFFANVFGISQQKYFIFALPVVLIILWVIPKIGGKMLEMDKKSNIKGDNHLAIIIILLVAPTVLGLHKLFGSGWKSNIIPGLILISLFSILSWIGEQKVKT